MITIKQGDTRHAIKATLKDVNGNPVDLTGATVNFFMATRRSEILVNKEALQQDGQVWAIFEEGETDTPGLMEAEFRVSYPDGRVESFPHDSYLQVKIMKNKGGAL